VCVIGCVWGVVRKIKDSVIFSRWKVNGQIFGDVTNNICALRESDLDCVVISYRDIAKRAGVSAMTVSRAMRGDPKVRAATSEKVKAAAQALGYQRNPIADSFMKQVRSKRVMSGVDRIAWIYPGPFHENTHVIEAYQSGAQARASALGFEMDTFTLGDGLSSARLRTILETRCIRGILISPSPDEPVDLDFDFSGFAVVTFGYSVRTPELNRVTSHHSRNQFATLDRLRELGYRNVLYVSTAQLERRLNFGWLAATLAYSEQHRSDMKVRHMYPDDFERRLEAEPDLSWLPEVILTNHLHLIDFLEERGRRVPEDVGFAVTTARAESYRGHRITGMNQCSREIGSRAVELLADSLAMNRLGVPDHPVALLVRGEWQDGDMLAPAS